MNPHIEKQKDHHANNTTNGWLERADIEDEGPQFVGLEKKKIPKVLRESGPIYQVASKIFPF